MAPLREWLRLADPSEYFSDDGDADAADILSAAVQPGSWWAPAPGVEQSVAVDVAALIASVTPSIRALKTRASDNVGNVDPEAVVFNVSDCGAEPEELYWKYI